MEVLVVDDDAPVRGTLRSLLTRGGHRVVEANDGQSAIERLAARNVETAFDLVITDLAVPRMSGRKQIDGAHDRRFEGSWIDARPSIEASPRQRMTL